MAKRRARCRYGATIRRLVESTTYEAHRSGDTAYDPGHGWTQYFTRSGRRASGFVQVAQRLPLEAAAIAAPCALLATNSHHWDSVPYFGASAPKRANSRGSGCPPEHARRSLVPRRGEARSS